MSTIQKLTFHEMNQNYLVALIAQVRKSLGYYLEHGDKLQNIHDFESNDIDSIKLLEDMEFTPPIETLCSAFGLSSFERDILLLCAGMELDKSLFDILGNIGMAHPTFSLALAALPESHWSAVSPAAPLRYWRLIELNSTDNLASGPLKIDENILHYLTGLGYFDERINTYIKPAPDSGSLVLSHQNIIDKVVEFCQTCIDTGSAPLIQFFGRDKGSQYAIASEICSILNLNTNTLSAQAIPHEPRELEALARLWSRQAALTQSALILDYSSLDTGDQKIEDTLKLFIGEIRSILILTGRERWSLVERKSVNFEVAMPSSIEQIEFWRQLLDEKSEIDIESLVSQFSLNTSTIKRIYNEVMGLQEDNGSRDDLKTALWEASREQSRHRLGELAERITPRATWDDLVLPEAPRQTLTEIAAQVRQRLKVYETWGFSSKISRGFGLTALFAGHSGTGKTMAAEVLANELHLDIFRIDLSQVVSKYIGETEKNLRQVFQAAEDGGAILLFDEADALFGKRSEVKDSHDRYANIEVSYLLQCMEEYHGLAILTTNMKEALDNAFLRRLRFIIQFPFPGPEYREKIWRRIFPPDTPLENLDFQKLARLNLSGGNIKNIALYAAFLAAEADEPISMKHLLRATRVEYQKLEISLTDSEIRGWL
jgi:hypothetical protein